MSGCFILLLHAHLPYVRHPEHEYSLEELWLFEAVRETYIPLINILECMVNDRISPRLTLSMSPTLMEMLNDELLRSRFVRYMDNLIELSEHERMRTRKSPFEPVAVLYNGKFKEARRLYLERYRQDLISPFRRLQDEGHIEITATSATHAFLPAFAHCPETVKRQIEVGIRSYIRNFGKPPAGFWLPECGYFNGLDSFLKDARIKYFFLESHGLLHGKPGPRSGIYRPVLSPSGLAVFGRDFKSSRQVWCASSGYPGDPFYRDFYRDIGFDLPPDYTGKFTRLNEIKSFTGMKYYRITGKSEEKSPYDRAMAMGRVSGHAAHFIQGRRSDLDRLSEFISCPVVFSAFDAELFGHWWFEGTDWLDAVLRSMPADKSFNITTPGAYLSTHFKKGVPGPPVRLAPSSWGEGGYSAVWIGKRNHYLYRHLHRTAERMAEMLKGKCRGAAGLKADTRIRRVVNQAERELLLAQASDWFFLMEKGRAAEYAESRVKGHIDNFNLLFSMLKGDNRADERLKVMEDKNRAFAWLDAVKDYCSLPSDNKSS